MFTIQGAEKVPDRIFKIKLKVLFFNQIYPFLAYFVCKYIYFYVSDSNFVNFILHLFKMSQRKTIIQLFCAGKTNPEIVKILKAPKSTVRDAANQYKELGTSDDCPKSGQSQIACTPTKIKAIGERIRRSPKWIRRSPKENG